MTTLEKTQILPLRLTEDGTIRVGRSRVSLDSIVHHYKLGASAEEIVERFPAVELADVYATIAYYLNNQETVEEYLREQEARADEIQTQIESDPQHREASAKLRARILARKSELKQP